MHKTVRWHNCQLWLVRPKTQCFGSQGAALAVAAAVDAVEHTAGVAKAMSLPHQLLQLLQQLLLVEPVLLLLLPVQQQLLLLLVCLQLQLTTWLRPAGCNVPFGLLLVSAGTASAAGAAGAKVTSLLLCVSFAVAHRECYVQSTVTLAASCASHLADDVGWHWPRQCMPVQQRQGHACVSWRPANMRRDT
jgi:hypothetical protein